MTLTLWEIFIQSKEQSSNTTPRDAETTVFLKSFMTHSISIKETAKRKQVKASAANVPTEESQETVIKIFVYITAKKPAKEDAVYVAPVIAFNPAQSFFLNANGISLKAAVITANK